METELERDGGRGSSEPECKSLGNEGIYGIKNGFAMFSLCKLNLLPRILILVCVPIVRSAFRYMYVTWIHPQIYSRLFLALPI